MGRSNLIRESIKQRSFGWLKKMGKIKVCVYNLQRKGLLWKLVKYMFVSFCVCQLTQCKAAWYKRGGDEDEYCGASSPTLRGHPLDFPWNSSSQASTIVVENRFCDCLHYFTRDWWTAAKVHWSMGHRPNLWGALWPCFIARDASAYYSLGMPAFQMIRRNHLIFHVCASTLRFPCIFPFF